MLTRDGLRFLGRLAIWYGIWLLLWIPLGSNYRRAFIATGNAVFALSGKNHSVTFQHLANPTKLGLADRIDVAVLVHHRAWLDAQGRQQHVYAKGIVTFAQPYAAMGFLLALFGATRSRWRARLLRAAIALGLLFGLIFACVAVDVFFEFLTNGAGTSQEPRWFVEIVTLLRATVTDWPAGVLIVPLLLWMLMCWPREGEAIRRGRKAPI